jgi:hypothetical protein
MDAFVSLLIGLFIIGYLFVYLSGRQYLREGFSASTVSSMPKPINTGAMAQPCFNRTVLEQNLDAPFLKRGILDVDDYEYNLIFQNEGDREMTKKLQNKLQSQYPMDWSVQPPSSTFFQQGKQRLMESFKNAPVQPSGENPYASISGGTLTPPDTTIQEMEERKILQTYQPKQSSDLITYSLEDAETLIKKIYNAKGLIPTVERKEENVYEIVGTRRKDEKIVYEDEEAPATTGVTPVAAAGEGVINVPAEAVDVSSGLDPFFSPAPSSHIGRWDYQKFTPGLERMFAPTYPTVEWY